MCLFTIYIKNRNLVKGSSISKISNSNKHRIICLRVDFLSTSKAQDLFLTRGGGDDPSPYSFKLHRGLSNA